MEEKQLTVKEVLEMVVKNLGNINIPVMEIDTIGRQIALEINNLKVCIDAMNKAQEEEAEKPEAEIAEVQEDA